MGHGHVIPNESGVVARCGGPALCPECALELAQLQKKVVSTGGHFFGVNLKRARDFLQMTQAELADKTGLTPAAICMIEKGEREPSLGTILSILKVIPMKFEAMIAEPKDTP